ncbi:MAG TPA: 23S rRNA (guanosine(2251)-2'-O)-methyltransferase RlmB [Flavobacteriaceae bacterium]|nr:23S rRNA (guanosine(2251)-2'-O)-methyltransferase RlmB [Flavobacteriaceae bacterium]
MENKTQKTPSKIFGVHAVAEAIESGQSIDKVFFQAGLRGDSIKNLERKLKENQVPISYVPIEKLERLAKQENHQGVVASISPVGFSNMEVVIPAIMEEIENPLFLLLDEISDVRNLGAIVRTAECTGVHAIILPKQGGAAINNETVKTSAGAIFNIPICKVAHLKDALFFLQSYEVQLIAATEKSAQNVYEVNFRKPTAIIMGSEGKGVSPSILKMVDQKAKLPILGKIESLNVSVACGAFLYEAVRQRNPEFSIQDSK